VAFDEDDRRSGHAGTESEAVVAGVVDGDTVRLEGGETVGLALVDAPDGTECHAWLSRWIVARILPPGTPVRLVLDASLPDADGRRRLVRHLYAHGIHLNLLLLERGAASVYFQRGARGEHGERFLTAARAAQARKLGAWGRCGAHLDPSRPWRLERLHSDRPRRTCDPAYPAVCIPPYATTGDLDCDDVPEYRDFPVRAPDPHDFDPDANGEGCEWATGRTPG
jgi:endonuclease YncB( thermonuclease family)